MAATRESAAERHGDLGVLVEADGDRVEDAVLGWPIRVSSFNHYKWTPTVEVSRWPEGDNPDGDPDHTFDLTADDAIRLALQLIAVAHAVREIEQDRQAQNAADEAIDAAFAAESGEAS
jgi:hypothetical protein